ncbi:hypothetical protein [Streptosporangium sp. NPDC020145]|uniref:hypothetical protein n=1 Tax=Streptosporangium sp. NPDC020145 TaxID=3154694 RepID=UPI00341B50B8
MAEQTRLSITTRHADGSMHRRTWLLPTEDALALAGSITLAYGPPRELLASAAAVQQMATTDVPGVVAL